MPQIVNVGASSVTLGLLAKDEGQMRTDLVRWRGRNDDLGAKKLQWVCAFPPASVINNAAWIRGGAPDLNRGSINP